MFDQPTDLTTATVANLITIMTGVMRKYSGTTGTVPDDIAELERSQGLEALAATKIQAKLAYLG